MRARRFCEPRYESSQVNAVAPGAIGNDRRANRVMVGQLQTTLTLMIRFTPIADVARQGLLVNIEIERGDPLTGFKQCHNDVHGKCGFATAALLVSDDDDVRPGPHATRWHDRVMHGPSRYSDARSPISPVLV